jgi:tRNA(Ile)-lysidine synthase
MRRETPLRPGPTLARPLLGVAKATLVAICHAAGQSTVDDPMNRDPAHARARLRAETAAALKLGLDTPTLTRLARRLARAEDALEAEARRLFAALETRRSEGQFAARLDALRDAEPEFLIRVLRLALEAAVPGGRTPRLDRLERLAEAIGAALRAGEPCRATLGGARVMLARDTMLTLAPEASRRRGRADGEPDSAAGPADCLKGNQFP